MVAERQRFIIICKAIPGHSRNYKKTELQVRDCGVMELFAMGGRIDIAPSSVSVSL